MRERNLDTPNTMKPSARKALRLAAIALLAVVALAAWWFLPARRAEVHLSPVSDEAVPRSAFATEPVYLQADPKWAGEKVGGSGEPLRLVGCTLCCLSMALAHHGIALDPMELNPNSEVEAAQPPGSTGNLPVPRGYQPRGREGRLESFVTFLPEADALPFRRASGPTARAGSPCHPFLFRSSG